MRHDTEDSISITFINTPISSLVSAPLVDVVSTVHESSPAMRLHALIQQHDDNFLLEQSKGFKSKSSNARSPEVDVEHISSTPDAVMVYPWSRRIERHLQRMLSVCQTKAELHESSCQYFNWWKHFWGLPGVLIPVIFSPLIPILKDKDTISCHLVTTADILTMLAFISTAFTHGVSNYFSFDVRANDHSKFGARFSDLVTDITASCLAPKKFRPAPDIFLTSLRIRFDNLIFSEPKIPIYISKKQKIIRNVPKT